MIKCLEDIPMNVLFVFCSYWFGDYHKTGILPSAQALFLIFARSVQIPTVDSHIQRQLIRTSDVVETT